jgi:hypothetical protein
MDGYDGGYENDGHWSHKGMIPVYVGILAFVVVLVVAILHGPS